MPQLVWSDGSSLVEVQGFECSLESTPLLCKFLVNEDFELLVINVLMGNFLILLLLNLHLFMILLV